MEYLFLGFFSNGAGIQQQQIRLFLGVGEGVALARMDVLARLGRDVVPVTPAQPRLAQRRDEGEVRAERLDLLEDACSNLLDELSPPA